MAFVALLITDALRVVQLSPWLREQRHLSSWSRRLQDHSLHGAGRRLSSAACGHRVVSEHQRGYLRGRSSGPDLPPVLPPWPPLGAPLPRVLALTVPVTVASVHGNAEQRVLRVKRIFKNTLEKTQLRNVKKRQGLSKEDSKKSHFLSALSWFSGVSWPPCGTQLWCGSHAVRVGDARNQAKFSRHLWLALFRAVPSSCSTSTVRGQELEPTRCELATRGLVPICKVLRTLLLTCASAPPLKAVLRSCHTSYRGLRRDDVLAWPPALRRVFPQTFPVLLACTGANRRSGYGFDVGSWHEAVNCAHSCSAKALRTK